MRSWRTNGRGNMFCSDVREIRYQPEGAYPYDLEIFRVSELRQRTSREGMRRTYGYTFYMLILTTEGLSSQLLDFAPCPKDAGNLVVVRPGQAHNFGESDEWDGWILLVHPDFLWSTSTHGSKQSGFDINRLPSYLHIDASGLTRAEAMIRWLRDDAGRCPPKGLELVPPNSVWPNSFIESMQAHLRYGFYTLISWLFMTYAYSDTSDFHKRPTLRRFQLFKELAEHHVLEWRSVKLYANQLGCTEKSLTRAVADAEGITAKEYLLRRLALEAKRLLIHTDLPIGAISDKLNFKEPTHFSKFFKRLSGSTPQDFRSSNG